MKEAKDKRLSILGFPGELLLHIFSFLSIEDVLTIQQTCTAFAQITRTSSLWLSFHQEQEKAFLLPVRKIPLPVPERLLLNLESDVVTAHRIAKAWAKPRTSPPIQLRSPATGPLMSMDIFHDRWLLCVSYDCSVNLWDLDSTTLDHEISTVLPCILPGMRSASLTSATAALDSLGEIIVLALTYVLQLPSVTHIYRVELPSPGRISQTHFHPLCTLVGPAPQMARSIEPALHCLLLSSTNVLDIVDFSDLESTSLNTAGEAISVTQTIPTPTDLLDELINSIVCSRIMGPYVVLFKLRSIELYLLKTDESAQSSSRTTPPRHNDRVQQHQFPSITIRTYSVSDYVVRDNSLSFSFLGSDFLQGMFFFDVSIRFATASFADASLHVECIGAYTMANDINLAALLPLPSLTRSTRAFNPSSSSSSLPAISPQQSPPLFGGPSNSPQFPIQTPGSTISIHSGIFGLPAADNSPSGTTRGFISTMALGPEAKRAVWVERKPGSTTREVLVWNRRNLSNDGLAGSKSENIGSGGTSEFDVPKNVVYRVQSYDLREDLKHCAIAEISGIIALGNRMGEIFVLKPDTM